jgi:hypothetical protein
VVDRHVVALFVLVIAVATCGCVQSVGSEPGLAPAVTIAPSTPAVPADPNQAVREALANPANITALEIAIHATMNRERNNWSAHNLLYDKNLAKISRAHSMDMAVHDYFSVTDLKNRDPSLRARESAYDCIMENGSEETIGIAESIYLIELDPANREEDYPPAWQSIDDIARYIIADSVSRDEAREILLYDLGERVGIGAALSPDGSRLYVTEDFC